jgi:hypothetical protein
MILLCLERGLFHRIGENSRTWGCTGILRWTEIKHAYKALLLDGVYCGLAQQAYSRLCRGYLTVIINNALRRHMLSRLRSQSTQRVSKGWQSQWHMSHFSFQYPKHHRNKWRKNVRRMGECMYRSTYFGLGTSWKWMASLTPRPRYLPEKTPTYASDRSLGRPQNPPRRSGEEKNLAPTRTRTPTRRSSSP